MTGFGEFLIGGTDQSQPKNFTPKDFQRLAGPVSQLLQGLFTGGPVFDPTADPSATQTLVPERTISKKVPVFGPSGPAAGERDNQTFTPSFRTETTTLPAIEFQQGVNAQTLAVPLTSLEQQFVNLIGQRGLQGDPTLGATNQFTQDVLGGRFLTPESNPFLQAQIEAAQRPVIQAFQDVALPRLQQDFTRAGQRIQPQSSSPFDRAAAIATRGLTQELGDISTQIVGENFARERALQEQRATQAPALVREQLDQSIKSLQAVALPRLVEQLGLDKGVEEFRRRVDTLLQVLGLSTSAAGATPVVPSITSRSSGELGNIVGAVAGAAASSKTLKTNKRPVEQVLPRLRNLKVEAWDYLPGVEDGLTHIGPYAEDFHAMFGVGRPDQIHMSDVLGVLTLAIQELDRRTSDGVL